MRETPAPRPFDRRIASALFLLLLGLYLLTTGGHFYASDEETMFGLTESMVLSHTFALNSGTGEPPRYSQYGPGQSVIAIPFYLAGQGLTHLFPAEAYAWLTRVAASWLNPIVTALLVALIFVSAQLLGYQRGPAVAAALAFGLGTMAWPHSKTFFAEPLTALGLVVALVAVQLADRRRHYGGWWWLVLSGLAAGFAPTVKIQSAIVLPFFGLYVLAVVWRWNGPRWLALLRGAVWGMGVLVPIMLLALYQNMLFGNPLRSGYGDVWSTFTTPFWYGFNGQLWSPGRGIIWYAPMTMLFPLAVWLMRREHLREALLCLAVFVGHILFYATWWAWDGAGAWGPRFLNVALPFLCLPLAAAFRAFGTRRWFQALLVLLVLLTVPVQMAGLFINLNGYIGVIRNERTSPFRFEDSAIAGHWRLGLSYLQRLYLINYAPNSLALRHGFSYAEGGDQLVPLWTLSDATFDVRPAGGQRVILDLQFSNCAVHPTRAPVELRLTNGVLVFNEVACPGRRLHLLLPARHQQLTLRTAPFDIEELDSDRAGPLGVQLFAASAAEDGKTLTLQADRLPTWPMPTGSQVLRRWMSDYRMAHWDFIWYYLQHNRFPASANRILGSCWLAIVLGLFVAGMVVLRRK